MSHNMIVAVEHNKPMRHSSIAQIIIFFSRSIFFMMLDLCVVSCGCEVVNLSSIQLSHEPELEFMTDLLKSSNFALFFFLLCWCVVPSWPSHCLHCAHAQPFCTCALGLCQCQSLKRQHHHPTNITIYYTYSHVVARTTNSSREK